MDGELYVMEKAFPNPKKEGVMLTSIYNTDMVKVLDNRRSQGTEKQPVMQLWTNSMPGPKVLMKRHHKLAVMKSYLSEVTPDN